MPSIYDYPTDAALKLIDKDYLDDMQMNDPIFDEFPIVETDDDMLMWEQDDNTLGLMAGRGLNGDPTVVRPLGGSRFIMNPGVYGEFIPIDEMELTRRRPLGQFNGRINISDLVARRQNQLVTRQMNRVKWVIWQLLINSTFNVLNATGSVVAKDSFKGQVYAPQVPWTTFATATPLNDLRQMQLLNRGHSVSFGAGAKTYLNQATINALLNNGNSADLYGRRTNGLATYNNLQQVNMLFGGDNLPQFVVYDDTYLSDGSDGNTPGSYQLFIPDGYIVVIGKRNNGAKIGEFRMTRNLNNPGGAPGVYSKVVDNWDRAVPRKIEVHRGFNGGPVCYFGSSVVVAKVF